MLIEVSAEAILVQVGLETENFLGNLLVFALDSLQLGLALVEVQALCFEFNVGDGMTFAKASLRQVDWSLLSCRDLHELLEQLLVVSLNLRLFD